MMTPERRQYDVDAPLLIETLSRLRAACRAADTNGDAYALPDTPRAAATSATRCRRLVLAVDGVYADDATARLCQKRYACCRF